MHRQLKLWRRLIEYELANTHKLDAVAFVGLHARIVGKTPSIHRSKAIDSGPQGGQNIRAANDMVAAQVGDRVTAGTNSSLISRIDAVLSHSVFVPTYDITDGLGTDYTGTSDRLHMGFWVNLQKVQRTFSRLIADKVVP